MEYLNILEILVVITTLNSVLDLILTFVLLLTLLYVFKVETDVQRNIAKGLERCRELTEMVQKVYNSMF